MSLPYSLKQLFKKNKKNSLRNVQLWNVEVNIKSPKTTSPNIQYNRGKRSLWDSSKMLYFGVFFHPNSTCYSFNFQQMH
jgi:hypothetical protein